jgi:hypothetical protein
MWEDPGHDVATFPEQNMTSKHVADGFGSQNKWLLFLGRFKVNIG